jgi:hypothetical protein
MRERKERKLKVRKEGSKEGKRERIGWEDGRKKAR